MPDRPPDEIVAPSEGGPLQESIEAIYAPLGLMPKGLGNRWKVMYEKLARKAFKQYRAAVYLKCIECVAWDRPEAFRCQITTCSLWGHNRRIFKTTKQE